jgi:hypothetical protein
MPLVYAGLIGAAIMLVISLLVNFIASKKDKRSEYSQIPN